MKKAILVFVVLSILLAGCSASASNDHFEKVTRKSLPADSEFAGTYSAEFSNQGQNWSDFGTYKPIEILFSKAVVHTAYLKGDMDHLVLFARPDYQWVWDQGGFFSRPGFVLKKRND